MGYSTPKKPFDLKEFLSQKATREQMRNKSRFRFSRRMPATETTAQPVPDAQAEPSAT
ncbi:hypothetical protein [Paenirhodobacter populi]|uniref:hypothetical protein n=1 Tax=Paenirhodobacter populi TaxID=2306993 RepID=UPI0013E2B985|nr:hypothetical protein [Sinirhodobacter populi]